MRQSSVPLNVFLSSLQRCDYWLLGGDGFFSKEISHEEVGKPKLL